MWFFSSCIQLFGCKQWVRGQQDWTRVRVSPNESEHSIKGRGSESVCHRMVIGNQVLESFMGNRVESMSAGALGLEDCEEGFLEWVSRRRESDLEWQESLKLRIGPVCDCGSGQLSHGSGLEKEAEPLRGQWSDEWSTCALKWAPLTKYTLATWCK